MSRNSLTTDFYAKRILSRIKKAECGRIEITLPNHQSVSHLGKQTGHNVSIEFKTWKSFFQYVLVGQLSFVEAYIDGDINISNLSALFHWFVDNEKYFPEKQNSRFSDIINRFSHLILNDNSRDGSRKNISFHYDLGNDFYKKWLDETMTYSAGIFADTKNLPASQASKYARIVDQLELSDGDSVLEIGCGWGGFAEHTLTRHHIDYRDTKGTFDKIVSIEMFEAVGEKHWQSYFETIKSRLKPSGKAVIQVITIEHDRYLRYRNRVDFIQKYIFPGGMLPSKQVFVDHAQKAGLKIVDEFAFGQDYAQTLRLWKENFLHNWSDIEQLERNTIDVMHYSVVHDHA